MTMQTIAAATTRWTASSRADSESEVRVHKVTTTTDRAATSLAATTTRAGQRRWPAGGAMSTMARCVFAELDEQVEGILHGLSARRWRA